MKVRNCVIKHSKFLKYVFMFLWNNFFTIKVFIFAVVCIAAAVCTSDSHVSVKMDDGYNGHHTYTTGKQLNSYFFSNLAVNYKKFEILDVHADGYNNHGSYGHGYGSHGYNSGYATAKVFFYSRPRLWNVW